MTLKSVSLFIGSNRCNGNCSHCAGLIHRQFAPDDDGIIDDQLIRKTLIECYDKGARSLSISSSGEPTLSPKSITKTFEIVKDLEEECRKFDKINLYSNGILIGEDENFCDEYLPIWNYCGLTHIYITVHNIDSKRNAKIYGIKKYPDLKVIFSRIHKYGIKIRANIVLSKNNIGTVRDFSRIVMDLAYIGADSISAWSVRDKNDNIDKELAPSDSELDMMQNWIDLSNVSDRVVLHREKDQLLYKEEKKLTLFPDGTLSNTWCNN